MNNLILCILGVFCILLLTVGCTSNVQYRTSFAPYEKPPAEAGDDPHNQAVIETTPDYKLGFVEFDDEGWFWDIKQAKAVEDVIRTEGDTARANNQAGLIIVVFVHGWKNNAAYDCGNVSMFRAELQGLNRAEQAQAAQGDHPRPPRKVVGVYCGWRGLSSKWEPFKELSIWGRKAASNKVGGRGAMTQLFVELEELQGASNQHTLAPGSQTELIIVGHSFGAQAVYSAISQFVTERFVQDLEKGYPLKPLGDQVILLNPAFEASRHFNLNQLATTIEKYPPSQRPVLSIFTSKGDWATHYLLPIGQFFPTLFDKTRNSFQSQANRQAVGWFHPNITHTLIYNTNSVLDPAGHSTFNAQTKKHQPHDPEKLRQSIQNVHAQRQKWHPNASTPQPYTFDDCILKPKSSFRPGDPFLVVSVDKKIMKDHDDIGNPVLINFLREYIQFCHSDPPTPAK